MNGFSQVRIGGTGARAAAPVAGECCTAAPMAGRAPARCSPDLHAPHVRLRHAARAGRARQGDPQPSTPRTTPRPSTRSASRSTTCWPAASSASRCICSTAASRPTTARRIIVTSGRAGRATAAIHRALIRGVVGRCSKPRTDMHYQHGPISTVAGHYARDILWPNSGRRAGGYRRHRLLRRLHLHHHAAARGLRLLQEGRGRRSTSATARSGSAAGGPTTPAAAISARATRTA